jgi:tRNA-2-methylthio-N6-dimethylallyladenosine synthase
VKTFFIYTMGCQMNEYDSDFMAQALVEKGLKPAAVPDEADIILVNTCTVREKPAQKAFSYLGRMSRIKRRNRAVVLGVTGCLAQEKADDLKHRFPSLDLIVGPRDVGRIAELVELAKTSGSCVMATDPAGAPPPAPEDGSHFKGRVSGFVSIMEGCNNFCTYCIVPYVRGREMSRAPDDILREAENLLGEGITDITLLGQNVNSYKWIEGGSDLRFAELLREVSSLPGLMRLRFTTSHPKDLSEDLIECFSTMPVLASHIHLPVQAGSNRVLRKMGRGYSREQYMALVATLRRVRPDIAVTSDVMVGFPGETMEDFAMTMDLIENVRFDGLFSFKYSDRDGTPAAGMQGKIPEEEKSRRLAVLQGFQKEITRTANRNLVGREFDVLVEGPGKRPGQYTGRTSSNKVVNFPAEGLRPGTFVQVVIRRGHFNSLLGDLSRR